MIGLTLTIIKNTEPTKLMQSVLTETPDLSFLPFACVLAYWQYSKRRRQLGTGQYFKSLKLKNCIVEDASYVCNLRSKKILVELTFSIKPAIQT